MMRRRRITMMTMIVVGKVKLSLEGVCGSGCIDPHFLDLGTS
jgi:hypothetical protein